MSARPFTNIKAEMTRNSITQKMLAEHSGVTQNTINNKLNGRTAMSVDEIIEWRDTFMPDATLDYLLARA